MFDSSLNFEGNTIVVNGATVAATCGPERLQALGEFEETMVIRKKIAGSASLLPHIERQEAEIDGVIWQVERSSVIGDVAVVTYLRYSA